MARLESPAGACATSPDGVSRTGSDRDSPVLENVDDSRSFRGTPSLGGTALAPWRSVELDGPATRGFRRPGPSVMTNADVAFHTTRCPRLSLRPVRFPEVRARSSPILASMERSRPKACCSARRAWGSASVYPVCLPARCRTPGSRLIRLSRILARAATIGESSISSRLNY